MSVARAMDPSAPVWEESVVVDDLMVRMRQASLQASGLLKALSHPDRLLLLCQLSQGEFCVSELEQRVGLGQPSLSQQLGILRQEGLVQTRRAGKQIFYSICSADALAVLQVLYQRFCPAPDLEQEATASFSSGSLP